LNGEEVSIEELEEARRSGALLIDVRQPEEYEAGHVPGARLVPMGDVVARSSEVPLDKPVYVICQTGVRSLKATRFYRSRGIDAWSVAGGTKDWAESGRPVVFGTDEG
jgi:rhodanese-related sulfurtransferase